MFNLICAGILMACLCSVEPCWVTCEWRSKCTPLLVIHVYLAESDPTVLMCMHVRAGSNVLRQMYYLTACLGYSRVLALIGECAADEGSLRDREENRKRSMMAA